MRTATKNILILLLLLLILSGFLFIYLPRYTKYQDLLAREAKLDNKIQELTRQINELRKEKYMIENDVEYLEKIARERLGHVKKGETVYRLVDADQMDEEKVKEYLNLSSDIDKA